jgi:hypothetical protein
MSSTKSIETVNWSALSANRNAIQFTTHLPPVPITRITLKEGKYYNIYYNDGSIYLEGAQYTGRYQLVNGIIMGGPKEYVCYFEKLVFNEMFQKDFLEENIIYISQNMFEEVKNQE